jgi:single-strand DNA-binding protein
MNSVNLIGRLIKDPDVRRADSGETICALTLAVDDRRAKEDRADFIRIHVRGDKAALCERYLRKGFLAGVTGYLRCEPYTDSEGAARYPVHVAAEDVWFLQWTERSGE